MKTSKVTSFSKQASCPSAETLLSFRSNDLKGERVECVVDHLAGCDFCCAEVQLLAVCPKVDDCETVVAEIPLSLRRLAEEIFSGSLLSADTFAGITYEKERLTLTDA